MEFWEGFFLGMALWALIEGLAIFIAIFKNNINEVVIHKEKEEEK